MSETRSQAPARVVSVNLSAAGGVPRHPVEQAEALIDGLAGDGRNHAKHDRSWRAVSLLDTSQLARFRVAGHEVGPGTMGENLTVEGLDCATLHPGDRLKFAGGVVLEISEPRIPCYVLDAIDERLQGAAWGCCGAMASIVEPGLVRTGETFILTGNRIETETALWPHTAALLAGGASRRMGARKAGLRLEPGGPTLLERVAGILRAVARRVVALGPGPENEAEERLGLQWIADRAPGCGPLAGVQALMQEIDDEAYLVAACDQPRLTPGLLRLLTERHAEIEASGADEGQGVFFRTEMGNKLDPFPGIFPATWRREVDEAVAEGRLGAQLLVRAMKPAWRTIPHMQADLLTNLNTPRDIAALREREGA